MIVLPNMPSPEATGSERKVLSLLRSVDWGGVSARALNSLNLAEHAYQRWGEIDFVLIGQKGFIAIEVKGGNVTCSDGKWRYEDRLGRVVVRGKSPIVQVKDAYFSLVSNYVSQRLGADFSTRVPAGFCVVLAGMARSDLDGLMGGPEFPNDLIGTREDLTNPGSFQKFLERVASYWQRKNNCVKYIAQGDVTSLVSMLRPEFERVRPLVLARERFEEEMLALTQEQYSVLDHWEGADRIFCSAAAGCGKTLLAVEMLRRANAEGSAALLLVGTPELASALRERTGLRAQVISIDEIEELEPGDRPVVATLIIDEGQQILTASRVEIVNSIVEGGIDRGRWAWFGDPNYQTPNNWSEAATRLEVFVKAASVRPRLSRNCRNTPEIITAAELASGVGIGHATVSGRGFHPSMSVADGREGAASTVVETIKFWLDQDIPLKSMILLTNDPNAEAFANTVARLGGFSASAWSPQSTDSLAYSNIESFRGLESGFVVLCIVGPRPSDEELGRMLYLGMTRGNFALAVVASPPILEAIKARMAANAIRSLEEQSSGL